MEKEDLVLERWKVPLQLYSSADTSKENLQEKTFALVISNCCSWKQNCQVCQHMSLLHTWTDLTTENNLHHKLNRLKKFNSTWENTSPGDFAMEGLYLLGSECLLSTPPPHTTRNSQAVLEPSSASVWLPRSCSISYNVDKP